MSPQRTVHSPESPLAFRVPPGWPEPNEFWVEINQGWELPHRSWVPKAGVPVAPIGWNFWAPTQIFDQLVRMGNRPRIKRTWWGLGFALLGWFLSTAGTVIFIGLILVGVWMMITGLVRRTSTNDIVMSAIRAAAVESQNEVMKSMYADYLRQAGK